MTIVMNPVSGVTVKAAPIQFLLYGNSSESTEIATASIHAAAMRISCSG